MAYIRFTPDEYQAIVCLYRPLKLNNVRPHCAKRLLATSLADTLPKLSEQITRLTQDQLRILLDHLRERPAALRPHGLTDAEVELVAEAGGTLLTQARFVHLLKRAIVRRLSECDPDLSMKVERLSLAQFAQLSQQVNERAQGNN